MITVSAEHARILTVIRIVHTAVWALFASCIVALPFAAVLGHWKLAGIVTIALLSECLILALNGNRCPLTDIAMRYTADRRPNFDIYLPQWLARWNKVIFGCWFVADLVTVAIAWHLK